MTKFEIVDSQGIIFTRATQGSAECAAYSLAEYCNDDTFEVRYDGRILTTFEGRGDVAPFQVVERRLDVAF